MESLGSPVALIGIALFFFAAGLGAMTQQLWPGAVLSLLLGAVIAVLGVRMLLRRRRSDDDSRSGGAYSGDAYASGGSYTGGDSYSGQGA